MRARLRRSLALALALGATLPALAHPRPYRHVHRRGAVYLRVEIGPPRMLDRPIVLDGIPMGSMGFDGRSKNVEVFVNGKLQGRVGDFDGSPRTLRLPSGAYRITLKTPDGERWSERIRVPAGYEIRLDLGRGN